MFFVFAGCLFFCCKNEKNTSSPVKSIEDSAVVESSAQADSTEVNHFIKRYSGHVGEFDLTLLMANWGNGSLLGKLDYEQSGTPLDFHGTLKNDKTFTLIETRNGEDNAWLEGRFEGNKLKGIWWNIDHSSSMPFELTAHSSEFENLGWTGVWHLNEIWSNGKLIIGDATATQFDFLLLLDSNNNKGQLYGTAEISGSDHAIFEMQIAPEFSEKCKLIFRRSGDHIKIEQGSFPFLCGFERIAYADGNYYDVLHEKKITLFNSDPKTTIFKNKTALNTFIELVGESNYLTFAYTMQKLKTVDVKDAKNNKIASACIGALRGLQEQREAIIMTDSAGNIWAAAVITNPEIEKDKGKLHYFTNVESMKTELPEYLKKWRKRFKKLELVYGSAIKN